MTAPTPGPPAWLTSGEELAERFGMPYEAGESLAQEITGALSAAEQRGADAEQVLEALAALTTGRRVTWRHVHWGPGTSRTGCAMQGCDCTDEQCRGHLCGAQSLLDRYVTARAAAVADTKEGR